MLRYFPPERRRRLAPLFLVVGLAIVGKLAHDDMPRDQQLTFVLPSSIESLRVTYMRSLAEDPRASTGADDELITGLERHFPEGAPTFLSHVPSLSPGHYRLAVELVAQDGGVTRLQRSIDVPTEGDLRVSLREDR
jgi:hypothetical protein